MRRRPAICTAVTWSPGPAQRRYAGCWPCHTTIWTRFQWGTIQIPVIVFDGAEFENLEGWNREASGKQGITTIMTDLNILRDFKGNVFVEVVLSLEDGKTLKVLISANRHLSFFKTLASSGMLALGTEGRERLITIQLPQPHKAKDALDIIEAGLTPGRK